MCYGISDMSIGHSGIVFRVLCPKISTGQEKLAPTGLHGLHVFATLVLTGVMVLNRIMVLTRVIVLTRVMVLTRVIVLNCVMVLTRVMVLNRVMVSTHVIVFTCVMVSTRATVIAQNILINIFKTTNFDISNIAILI